MIVAHEKEYSSSGMVSGLLEKTKHRTAGSHASLEVGDKGKTGESR
jgi:hypothetical protein